MKTALSLNFIGILLAFFFSYNAQLSRQYVEKNYEVARERVESKNLERVSGYLETQRGVLKSLWLLQSFTCYSIFLILGSSIYMLVHVIKSPKNEE